MEAGWEGVCHPWDIVAVICVAVNASIANPSDVLILPGCGCIVGILLKWLSDAFVFAFAFAFVLQFRLRFHISRPGQLFQCPMAVIAVTCRG
jgi:hypothetical protein